MLCLRPLSGTRGRARRGLGFDFDFGALAETGGEALVSGDFSLDSAGNLISDFNPEDFISDVDVESLIGEGTDQLAAYNDTFQSASQSPPVFSSAGPPVPPPRPPPTAPRVTAAPPGPTPEQLRIQAYWEAMERERVRQFWQRLSDENRAEYWRVVQEQRQLEAAPTTLTVTKKKTNWTPYLIAAALVGAAVVLR